MINNIEDFWALSDGGLDPFSDVGLLDRPIAVRAILLKGGGSYVFAFGYQVHDDLGSSFGGSAGFIECEDDTTALLRASQMITHPESEGSKSRWFKCARASLPAQVDISGVIENKGRLFSSQIARSHFWMGAILNVHAQIGMLNIVATV